MERRTLLAASAASLLLAGCAPHHARHYARHHGPRREPLSQERLDRMAAAMQADVDAGRLPGAVMLVERRGQRWERAIGTQDPAGRAPMRMDSIFRIYSMTKPIVSVAAMMLVEDGRIMLADPVSKHLPELRGLRVGVERPGPDGRPTLELVPAQREMTVHDLLRHTSGLTYGVFGRSLVKAEYLKAGADSNDISNQELVAILSKLPLAYQPGSTWEYSRSTDLLGALLERVAGRTLDVLLAERILAPLRMVDTGFWVEPSKQGRIAEPFATDPDTKAAVRLIEVRRPPKYLSGGGGMVSTAADYLRFCRMMNGGGSLDGVRILSPATARFMLSDHLGPVRGPGYLPGPGYGFGLGFAVRTEPGRASTPGNLGESYWGGFGGTYFWIDPRGDTSAIWMMQAPGQREHYRQVFRNMVHAAYA